MKKGKRSLTLATAAVVVAVFAYGADRGSDKPSPVPRRPTRPQFDSASNQRKGALSNTDERRAGKAQPAVEGGKSRESESAQETGTACFFTSEADGAITASGARLDSEQLVGAHPRFPLGSTVRVKNLASGKTVEVRIVDRFPGGSGRVINVSEAAAQSLGFVKAGTAQVALTLSGSAPESDRH